MFYSKSTYFTRALSMIIYEYRYKLIFHGTTNNYLAKKSRDDSECEILVRVHFIVLHWWRAFFRIAVDQRKLNLSLNIRSTIIISSCLNISVPYSSSLLIVLYC